MSKKFITNKQLLNRIAEAHPLGEAFIIEAVHQYATSVHSSGLPDWPENGIIAKDAWLECAREALNHIDNRNEG